VAFLVVLMVMLGCFSIYQLAPPGLSRMPGNWVLGLTLFVSAIAVALRRRWSYPVGLVGCLIVFIGGLLAQTGRLSAYLVGQPILWILGGLYVAFRLVLNHHAEQIAARSASP
jgi:hypothetical protein